MLQLSSISFMISRSIAGGCNFLCQLKSLLEVVAASSARQIQVFYCLIKLNLKDIF